MDERAELIRLVGAMTETQWAWFRQEAVKVIEAYMAGEPVKVPEGTQA